LLSAILNVERPTSNVEWKKELAAGSGRDSDVRHSTFDVQRSMFDVRHFSNLRVAAR
jgi:hypothetical protein